MLSDSFHIMEIHGNGLFAVKYWMMDRLLPAHTTANIGGYRPQGNVIKIIGSYTCTEN